MSRNIASTLLFIPIILDEVLKNYISQEVDALSDFDSNTEPEITEDIGPAFSQESSSAVLLEIKTAFQESLCSLDLFESYLTSPNEESVKRLKLFFNHEKSAQREIFTHDKINNFLDFLRSCLIKKCSRNDESNNMDFKCAPNLNENSSIVYLSDKNNVVSVFPQTKKKKQREGNSSNPKHPGTDKKIMFEKKLEEDTLKSKNSFQFLTTSQRTEDLKVLKDQIHSLKEKIIFLQSKNEDLLSELGKLAVQTTAKENKERKYELFQEIFRRPSSEAAALPACEEMSSNDMNAYADLPSVNHCSGTSAEQHVQGADALVQPGKQVIVASCKIENQIQKDQLNTGSSSFKKNNGNYSSAENPSITTASERTTSANENNQSDRAQETSGLSSRQSNENISLSVQQTDSQTENISLGIVPPTSVATTLYNNYKLLLLSLGPKLLSSDVEKLKEWARENFSINDPQNATDVLLQLDQKAVINASNLSPLVHFFESIVRIDLVHIIDTFLLGDYSLLRQISRPKQQTGNAARTSQHRSARMYQNLFNAMNTGRQSLVSPATSDTSQTNTGRNAATRFAGNCNETQRSPPEQVQRAALRNLSDTAIPARRSPNENQSTASEQQNLKLATTGFGPNRMADIVVADGSNVTNERRTMAGNFNPSVTNNSRNSQAFGSNGSKHSKFQRSGTERSDVFNFQLSHSDFRKQFPSREDNWLCTHYKRHCYVKFECCDTFWPCHRCHNNQSTCGQKKLKSRDTKMVKCAYCNKEQQFGTSCCNCGVKFSEYYCGLCKHLTGTDDNPYHCDKCGICRIHGDRSYHCDVCGVCLDVQLRGNHKCREGSAHDECCICLEDAFTGCQILPCSHKVHRECATQMIRSGITRCPICRESFEHKLERRPLPNSRKRSGK